MKSLPAKIATGGVGMEEGSFDGDASDFGQLSESSFNTSNETGSTEEDQLAHKETRAVNILRGLVVFILLLATASVSFVVYKYTSLEEARSFRNAFDGYAGKVIESSEASMQRNLRSMDNFATEVTSFAITQQATWPFFTVPNFPILSRYE